MGHNFSLTISADSHENLIKALQLYIDESDKKQILDAYGKLFYENTQLKIDLAVAESKLETPIANIFAD